jgi:hypothetical protein
MTNVSTRSAVVRIVTTVAVVAALVTGAAGSATASTVSPGAGGAVADGGDPCYEDFDATGCAKEVAGFTKFVVDISTDADGDWF